MDDRALIQKVQEASRSVSIILRTTEVEPIRVTEAVRAGVSNDVAKPFTAKLVGEKIRQTLATATESAV
jgi:response regulator of citrate/malate metabolism